jgi:hypothetical protein
MIELVLIGYGDEVPASKGAKVAGTGGIPVGFKLDAK